jgi:hypothetical protein
MLTHAQRTQLLSSDRLQHLDRLRIRLNASAHQCHHVFNQLEAKCAWTDLMCILYWDQGEFIQ